MWSRFEGGRRCWTELGRKVPTGSEFQGTLRGWKTKGRVSLGLAGVRREGLPSRGVWAAPGPSCAPCSFSQAAGPLPTPPTPAGLGSNWRQLSLVYFRGCSLRSLSEHFPSFLRAPCFGSKMFVCFSSSPSPALLCPHQKKSAAVSAPPPDVPPGLSQLRRQAPGSGMKARSPPALPVPLVRAGCPSPARS